MPLGFRPESLRLALDDSVNFDAGYADRDGNLITDPREQALETINVATVGLEPLDFKRVFSSTSL